MSRHPQACAWPFPRMADLPTLLSLLQLEPVERFTTAEAVVSFRVNLTVIEGANEEFRGSRGATGSAPQRRSAEGAEKELRGRIQIWSRPPDSVRVNYTSPSRQLQAIRNQEGSWTRSDEGKAWVQGSASLGSAAVLMLDPGALLGSWAWSLCDEVSPAGAYAVAAAKARSFLGDYPVFERVSRPFGLGADSWRVIVANNGTLQRVDAHFHGAPYTVHELIKARFDDALPSSLFTLGQP